jgi:enoyl-[acyl-carrier protein] reductase III
VSVEFAGKLALITGGGRGIGRAIALELAQRGADVLINYVRHPDAADAVALEIRGLGRTARTIRANVADEDSVKRMFAEVGERFGYLDFLINNSASGVNRASTEVAAKHWDWTLNVNARGAWLCARAALPLMQARGGGAVVSISSLGASWASPKPRSRPSPATLPWSSRPTTSA